MLSNYSTCSIHDDKRKVQEKFNAAGDTDFFSNFKEWGQPPEKNARKQHALGGRRCNVPIVATKEKEYHEIFAQNLSKENENYTPLQSRCLYL